MMFHTPASKVKLNPLTDFLKTMGIDKEPEAQPSFVVKSGSNLPEETKVVVLDYQRN